MRRATCSASASAGAFNQYYEHDTDRLMARTRRRAFATGALPHTPAWLLLIGVLLVASVGAAWWVLNGVAALYVFLGAFFYELRDNSGTNLGLVREVLGVAHRVRAQVFAHHRVGDHFLPRELDLLLDSPRVVGFD